MEKDFEVKELNKIRGFRICISREGMEYVLDIRVRCCVFIYIL